MTGKTPSAVLLIAAAVCGTGTASGDIVIPLGGPQYGAVSFSSLFRFGQSFTATSAEPVAGTVSFMWWRVNSSHPAPTIAVRLCEGVGYSGAVLATQTVTVLSGLPDQSWVDFVFPTPAALGAGWVYSLEFALEPASPSSGGYYRVDFGHYNGGTLLDHNGVQWWQSDLCFRVLTVPGPGAIAALFLGMCPLSRRKRGVRVDRGAARSAVVHP